MVSIQELPQGRAQLVKVLSGGKDVIRIEDVAQLLKMSRPDAAKRLSRWHHQGWFRRVGAGAYVPLQLQSQGAARVVEDPWILAPVLYSPGYIGGWTAAEHWDLTEQIFKDTVILTAQQFRKRHQVHDGIPFLLKHIDLEKQFGLKQVWRQKTKVSVSDVHRTIVDMLDDPALGGGIQHVSECLSSYLGRPDRDDHTLIAYAERLGNGAVFKRLGFLAERQGKGTALASECRSRLTKGNAMLDPALKSPRIVSTWHLRVPPTWIGDRV
jgi:predicted transcriptional regulator of viral defense system